MGPGKYIGAVTQMRTAPLSFIVENVICFFCVGLCPHGKSPCRTHGDIVGFQGDREASIAWTRVHVIEINARFGAHHQSHGGRSNPPEFGKLVSQNKRLQSTRKGTPCQIFARINEGSKIFPQYRRLQYIDHRIWKNF